MRRPSRKSRPSTRKPSYAPGYPKAVNPQPVEFSKPKPQKVYNVIYAQGSKNREFDNKKDAVAFRVSYNKKYRTKDDSAFIVEDYE